MTRRTEMANVPNFDAMDHDDLMDYWVKMRHPSRRMAEEVVGDRRPGYTLLARDLAAYAATKAAAMTCRVRGDIEAALVYELICEIIYKDLPVDLRW